MRLGRKLGYAAGDAGISVAYFSVGLLFLFYLTDVVGLSPFLAGLAFFIGKLWDGVNDPLVGWLCDRTRSRWGRKRAYLLFGAIPFALSFILLWMVPLQAPPWLQFGVATAVLLLFSTTYSLVAVPYMALIPVLSRDYDERTELTGLRAIFSTGGILVGAVLLGGLKRTGTSAALQHAAIWIAAAAAMALFLAAWSVKSVDDRAPIVPASWRVCLDVLRLRPVRILLGVKFLGALGTGCLTAAFPYFSRSVLGQGDAGTRGVGIYVLTAAVFLPIWCVACRHGDKRILLLGAMIGTAIVLAGLGLFLPAGAMLSFFVGCFFLGAFMSSYILIPYSLVPDLAEVVRVEQGERVESILFGWWMTIHQLGIAVSGLFLGLWLQIGGYSGKENAMAASSQLAVRLGFGILPGVFLVLTACLLLQYPITREYCRKLLQPGTDCGIKTAESAKALSLPVEQAED